MNMTNTAVMWITPLWTFGLTTPHDLRTDDVFKDQGVAKPEATYNETCKAAAAIKGKRSSMWGSEELMVWVEGD